MTKPLIVPYDAVCVFSEEREARSIKCAVERLQASKKKSRYNRYYLDGRGPTRGDDPDYDFLWYPPKLMPLWHTRQCVTESMPASVGLALHNVQYQPETLLAMHRFAQRAAETPISGFGINCRVSASGAPHSSLLGEYGYTCGWQVSRSGGRCFLLGVYDFSRPTDSALRAEYLRKAAHAMGLQDRVLVSFDAGRLTITSLKPEEPPIIKPDSLLSEPHGLDFLGFASFDEAWSHVERALRDPHLVARIERLSLVMGMTPPTYEDLLDDLNALASGWELSFWGSYADGIDPYTAEASQSPDGQFPVFVWNPHESYIYFEADVVPTPAGRRLQVHSNCGDIDRLLKEAAPAGVAFTPISRP